MCSSAYGGNRIFESKAITLISSFIKAKWRRKDEIGYCDNAGSLLP